MTVLAVPSLLLFLQLSFVVLLMVYLAFHKTVALPHRTKSTTKTPPGRLGLPVIGETVDFLANYNSNKGIYHFVHLRRLRYGNCFKTRIFGKVHVFISGTESAKAVLGNDVNFTKRYIRSMAELVGEQSLLCVSQEQHQFIRTRLSHLVSIDSLSLFIKHFDDLVVSTLTTWDNRNTVIVLEDALKITFNGMCKMLLSLDDTNELQMLQNDVAQICEAMLSVPLKLPFTGFYKGLKARKRVMGRLKQLMDMRRKDLGKNYKDFMQSLLPGERMTPSGNTTMLTDTQIQDNILTLIIAGQVTTASAITWMVKYLHENQEIQEKLRKEQKTIHKAPQGSSLTVEDLNKMPNASKVVKESLRIASVVAWFPRIALKDCEVAGFSIKKGWIVNIDAKAVHLDPTLFRDPTKFDPSRFDEELKPYSFLAFGTGGRTCLGMNMAKMMMVIFLHRLLITYRWKVIDSDSNLEKRALFSRLRSGCPVQVTHLGAQ